MAKNILIVDDSQLIRKKLRAMLQGFSTWHVCGEAVNGRDAISQAQRLAPDLVVLDLSMPIMNGLEAARELKRLNPAIQLLMFTTFKTDHFEKEATAAGCSAVLSKTDPPKLLLGAIHRLLHS